MQDIVEVLKSAIKDLFNVELKPELTRPDEQFGDFATNVAMQLGGRLHKNPREIAVALASKLHNQPGIADVQIAGPGFINIRLTDSALLAQIHSTENISVSENVKVKIDAQEILVEFGDPNPFKEMHIGHLYSYIVGDSISNLLESSGAMVQRLSYHGDVGRHVARALWGMKKEGAKIGFVNSDKTNIGHYYTLGAQADESDEQAKREIDKINQAIYNQSDPTDGLYEWGREFSFKHFDKVLKELGIKTDKRYLESESTPAGLETVRKHIGKVFKESEGAVIFEGEKVGLHTRVFITSKGLPTYEAKDLGLVELKSKDYPNAARSIIITANEQTEYFKVMLAALKEFDEQLANKTKHIAHGFLSLSTGKMSSRTGNIYSAQDLLDGVRSEVERKYPDTDVKDIVYLAAVKYSMLKHRLGQDIVVDVKESVSLEGNSGPYLQYAHARARNIMAKAGEVKDAYSTDLDDNERSLARKLSEYPEAVEKATNELLPHHVATYLYELSQVFNRFYEKSRVIGDEREAIRLKLVEKYADRLKEGLELLGIIAPDKM
jgi:arginyl-tRNA synthetase